MGVKGLYSYINKHCSENGNGMRRPLSYFENKTIIIDVSIYMYKFKYLNVNIIELFDNLINYLINFNIKVMLVFDGSQIISTDKNDERDARKIQKETTKEIMCAVDKELQEVREELESRKGVDISELLQREKALLLRKRELEKTITQVTQKERKELYDHLEKTYRSRVDFIYENTEEADKMISRYASKSNGRVIVMSDDTDMFLYGSPIVAMNYDYTNHTVSVYNLNKILKSLNVTLSEFVQVCVVLGTDYLSPYHKDSPLPKISITQMFQKFYQFKQKLYRDGVYNTYKKHKNYYVEFIDLMCFVYWKNSKHDPHELNRKLWSIFEVFYEL